MAEGRAQLFRFDFKAMGSPCEIQLFAGSPHEARRIFERLLSEIQRIEARYSRYRDDSLLSAINRASLEGGSTRVDEETAGLLDYAAVCHLQSGGLFDITSGVLRRAWRFDHGVLPRQSLIDALLDKVGWERLDWSPPILGFSVPGMEIDLGGVVKEYAADRAAALCRAAGIGHGVINLGGDIRCLGPRPDGSPWRVGIRHPRSADGLILDIGLRQGGLASSGDYERCIVLDGVRYSHILHPKTGWPVRHLASVSVVADLCVIAGSASTIAMLKEEGGPEWLESLGLPHFWVDAEGRTGGSLAETPSQKG